MDEDRDPAVGEDLEGLAADEDRRDAASTVRSHDDEIAAPGFRSIDDRLVGVFMLGMDRSARHPG